MTRDLIQTILERRSIRKYTSESVSEQAIQTLLETAMAAPSASNRKPWQFVVVTRRETLDALAEAHAHGKMLFEASDLMRRAQPSPSPATSGWPAR